MKLNAVSLFSLLLFATLCSCHSTKNLELLQNNAADNIKAQELVKTLQIQEKQHKISPADRLMLNIFSLTDEKVNFLKEPQVEQVVDTKGQIELPVIGAIPVAGLTIKEAEDKIEKAAADYLRSPSVTIKLMNFQVTVLGEVLRQGTFVIPEPKVNVLEALGQAGGLTENANRQNLRIIRSENNTAKIYRLNLLEDNSLMSQNFFLSPGDIVLVNPRRAVADRQTNFATISLVFSLVTSFTFFFAQVINR